MYIIAVDQARHGAWAIFDYEKKKLVQYDTFSFDNTKYSFEQAVLQIETMLDEVIHAHNVGAVFIEDIQLQKNAQSFKKLAQLQGVLVNLCEKNEYLYQVITPTQWQSYCKARGRKTKEIKEKVLSIDTADKKASKVLSLQFVKDNFSIDTDNDNLADAICIGWYCVNNIKIEGDCT